MVIFKLSAHAQKVIKERNINMDWIEQAFNKPDKIESDKKNDILEHRLKVIEEYYDRVLRLVCNTNEKPVLIVTAFFDRRMKGIIK